MAESSKQQTAATGQKLVSILNELLDNKDWDASLFLRTTKKRFMALRDEAQAIVDDASEGEATGRAGDALQKLEPPEGYTKVYIFLYQADGNNLQLWQKLLRSIVQHSLTRPVYGSEEDIRALIRSKPDTHRLGYAAVAVKEEDIVEMGTSVDRFGHKLLTLAEGAIKLENILGFVHSNKRHYLYKNHTLVLISTETE